MSKDEVIYLNIGSSVIFNTIGVPGIYSFKDMAEQLSITEHLLHSLTYNKKYHYYERMIPKKDGSDRRLNVPDIYLKVVQKWILKEILQKISVSNQAMAFVPKKNGLKENAERHKQNVFVLEMDITDFFGSICEKQVYELFRLIGYDSKVSGILSNLCTYNDRLPQGAITSPCIANLVCYHLDARINGYCGKKDVVFTRYADDLTFSSNNRAVLGRMIKFLKYIIEDEGFKINEKKTRFFSNDVKKTVTGITINNNTIHVDKGLKRILRAKIFQSIVNMDYSEREKILGMISFVNSIEEGFREKIINYIESIIVRSSINVDYEVVDAFNSNKFFSCLPDMSYRE